MDLSGLFLERPVRNDRGLPLQLRVHLTDNTAEMAKVTSVAKFLHARLTQLTIPSRYSDTSSRIVKRRRRFRDSSKVIKARGWLVHRSPSGLPWSSLRAT